MPSSDNYVRDYKQERATAKKRGETANGSNSGDAKRHRARRKVQKKLGRKLGANEVVHHKKRVKDGGSNKISNLAVTDRSSNASDGGKVGNRKGKSNGGRNS